MLYIDETRKVPLPRRHHAANNICAIIYDQLTEILTEALYDPLTFTPIDISNKDLKFTQELIDKEIHAFEFLAENKKTIELEEALVKYITMSILGDFVNFVYEALSCAQRGKMEVAYSLLRKPFLDELLIFEQILVDKTDFVTRFYHKGEPRLYDPSDKKINKKEIIEQALKQIKIVDFLSDELIYTLRYDKKSPSGINGLSNQALHIVTTDPNYKTNNQELNFVFSVKEDHQHYWDHFYYFVPHLLFYSVAVVDEILFKYIPGELAQAHKIVKEIRRLTGFLLLSEKNNTSKKQKANINFIYEALRESLCFKCDICKKENRIEGPDLKLFF